MSGPVGVALSSAGPSPIAFADRDYPDRRVKRWKRSTTAGGSPGQVGGLKVAVNGVEVLATDAD
jgi:homoserine kinase